MGQSLCRFNNRCCYFDAANVEYFFISPKQNAEKLKEELANRYQNIEKKQLFYFNLA